MAEAQAQEVRRRVAELERELGLRHIMPNISLWHIRQGLRCWRDGDLLVMGLPFRYKPKYLIMRGVQYRIKTGTAAKMAKDTEIWVWFSDGQYSGADLKADNGRNFSHYHDSCWGTLTWPTGDVVQAFFQFRDSGQRLLEVINGGNLAVSGPNGLPSFDELLKEAEEVGTWQQEKEPEPAPSGPAPSGRRGGWTA